MARTAHTAKFIRFPPALAQQIEAVASRERRTFTAQLLLMLEQWLDEHGERAPPPVS